ncbi:MAG: heavy-metal-associated domain-containing protein [Candidatus Moduliflexus flocculans]|nr:heavy-metal-associated domain-containing protein [Candidatus Moduliflexus flocculans]
MTGMSCAGCAANVERALRRRSGRSRGRRQHRHGQGDRPLRSPRRRARVGLVRGHSRRRLRRRRPGRGRRGRGRDREYRSPPARSVVWGGAPGPPHLPRQHAALVPLDAGLPAGLLRSLGPGDPGPVRPRAALLPRRLERPPARRGQHEHARRRGHVGRLPLQRRGHGPARVLPPGRDRAPGLLRHLGRHHRPHPLRADARGPGQGPDVRRHPPPHGPAAAARPASSGPTASARSPSKTCASATSSSSGPARPSRSTASSSRASPPSTSP